MNKEKNLIDQRASLRVDTRETQQALWYKDTGTRALWHKDTGTKGTVAQGHWHKGHCGKTALLHKRSVMVVGCSTRGLWH